MSKNLEDRDEELGLSRRVGSLLKEAREGRRLSTKDVGRETNITPRYIEALENEDYTQFPGETYTLGFLRAYSDYLGLDTDQVVNLYRGLQIDQTQTPLRELTRPTTPIQINRRTILIAGGGALVVFLVIVIASSDIFRSTGLPRVGGDDDANCRDRELIAATLPQVGAPARTENLSGQNAVRLTVDTGSVKLCLNQVKKTQGGPSVAVFDVRVNDETNYTFRANEGETITLAPSVKELSSLTREVKITPRVVGDVSARVQIESGESVKAAGGNAAVQGAGGDIQITLQFVNDSYFDWTDDGNSHQGLTIEGGQTRTLEAKNRLEIKVGDAGSVRILRDGYPPKIAGPPAKIVKIVYKKVPDPLDPGVHKVVETIEVAQ